MANTISENLTPKKFTASELELARLPVYGVGRAFTVAPLDQYSPLGNTAITLLEGRAEVLENPVSFVVGAVDYTERIISPTHLAAVARRIYTDTTTTTLALSRFAMTTLGEELAKRALANLTWLNGYAVALESAAATFSVGDLAALIDAVQSAYRTLLLRPAYFGNLVQHLNPANGINTLPGFDGGVFEVADSLWPEGVAGAVVAPGAVAVCAGAPKDFPEPRNATVFNMQNFEVGNVPVALVTWGDSTGRTIVSSAETIFGAVPGVVTQAALIKMPA